MTPKTISQIITANDLLSGEVVYFSKSGAWSTFHQDAILFEKPDAAGQLSVISRDDGSVVGPYLVQAKIGKDHKAAPMHFREVFRAAGPTNRFIGKQASPS